MSINDIKIRSLKIFSPTGSILKLIKLEIHKDPIRLAETGILYKLNCFVPDGDINMDVFKSETYSTDKRYQYSIKIDISFDYNGYNIPSRILYLWIENVSFSKDGKRLELLLKDLFTKELEIYFYNLNYDNNKYTPLSYLRTILNTFNSDILNLIKTYTKDITLLQFGLNTIENNMIYNPDYKSLNSSLLVKPLEFLTQGIFECPAYSIFDTFSFSGLKENVGNCFLLNIGGLNINSEVIDLAGQLTNNSNNILVFKNLGQDFIDKKTKELLNDTNNIDYEFLRGGSFDTCIQDNQNTGQKKRLIVNSMYGQITNTKKRICCILKLLNKSKIYEAELLNSEISFNNFYTYSLDKDIVNKDIVLIPLVLNYNIVPMENGLPIVTNKIKFVGIERNFLQDNKLCEKLEN